MARCILCLLALVGLTVVSPTSAQPTAWRAAPGSWIHIDGRAGPMAFRCSTEHAFGTFRPDNARRSDDGRGADDGPPHFTARVAIDGLECGIDAMNRDLQVALRADQYPYITVVISALLLQTPEHVIGGGTLNLAGVERPLVGRAAIDHESATVILSGELDIDTERHGVELPRPLGGLVRVHPHMRVSYRVLIRYDPTEVRGLPANAPPPETVGGPFPDVRSATGDRYTLR